MFEAAVYRAALEEREQEEAAMAFQARFAGYESPDDLVADRGLTREQKIIALRSWRSAVLRQAEGADELPARRLVRELDRALEAVRRS